MVGKAIAPGGTLAIAPLTTDFGYLLCWSAQKLVANTVESVK